MYQVTIIHTDIEKPLIKTKANSLREVKGLIRNINTDTPIVRDVLIEDLKTGAYIALSRLKFWARNDFLPEPYPEKHKLAKGICKSGFIKDKRFLAVYCKECCGYCSCGEECI